MEEGDKVGGFGRLVQVLIAGAAGFLAAGGGWLLLDGGFRAMVLVLWFKQSVMTGMGGFRSCV
jgi:hypothetical protein